MGYIYKITNDVNGKMYIGKTELVDPYKRWKEHLQDYKKRRCEKRPLYAAMNKYGEEHFHFEVIEETNDTVEREQYWINKLRTYVGFKDCNGYNATLGGDGKVYLNLDEDEVIRYHTEEANYIIKSTAKYFNVDFKTIKNILVNNNVTWLKSKDAILLRKYELTGGIYQVSIKNKMILNIFENNTEANIYLHKPKDARGVTAACLGSNNGSHYAYGYLWYYGRDLNKAIENNEILYYSWI